MNKDIFGERIMETKSDPLNQKSNELKLSIENISSSGTLPGPAIIVQIQGDINIFSAKKLKDAFNEAIEKKSLYSSYRSFGCTHYGFLRNRHLYRSPESIE